MTDSLFARFGREYRAGDVLFMEGETGEEMFVIQSGSVQVSKRIGDEERPLATLGRGELLGEMAILNHKPRTASAVVLEDTTCLVIDGKTLETMIQKNPEIAMRLVKTLAKRLEAAVEDGDAAKVAAEHRELVRWLDKAVSRGALHRNAAARKKSQAARLVSGRS